MMPKQAAVARKAYELWEQAGRPENQSQRFWFQAEEILESREYGQDHAQPTSPQPGAKRGNGGAKKRGER